jgi:hypothetical protein
MITEDEGDQDWPITQEMLNKVLSLDVSNDSVDEQDEDDKDLVVSKR